MTVLAKPWRCEDRSLFPTDRRDSNRNRSVLISRSAEPPRTLDAIDKPSQLCVTLAPQEAPDHAARDGHAGLDQGMKERAGVAAVLGQAWPRRGSSVGGPGGRPVSGQRSGTGKLRLTVLGRSLDTFPCAGVGPSVPVSDGPGRFSVALVTCARWRTRNDCGRPEEG